MYMEMPLLEKSDMTVPQKEEQLEKMAEKNMLAKKGKRTCLLEISIYLS